MPTAGSETSQQSLIRKPSFNGLKSYKGSKARSKHASKRRVIVNSGLFTGCRGDEALRRPC